MAGDHGKIVGASLLFALLLAAASWAAGTAGPADGSEEIGLNNRNGIGRSYSHTIFGELASQDT